MVFHAQSHKNDFESQSHRQDAIWTRRLHNIRWHPHISSQKHSSDLRRTPPSDRESSGRHKRSHARQRSSAVSTTWVELK
eukprot:scaffold19250_cov145-Isochrysis_galbana.AAC.1